MRRPEDVVISKLYKCALVLSLLSSGIERGSGQAFRNLDFESGFIRPGTVPGSDLPINTALLGWNGYLIDNTGVTNVVTQIVYDGISLGGAFISVTDSNT